MAAVSYTSLTEKNHRWMDVRLEKCTSAPNSRAKMRLCFERPDLQNPDYRIALVVCPLLCEGAPFTVAVDGQETRVLLNRKSLLKRLNAPKWLADRLTWNDNLRLLVRLTIYKGKPCPIEPDYFVKNYHYGMRESIYAGSEIWAETIKDSKEKEGGFAKVVKARLANKIEVACRLCDDTIESRALVQTMRRYCGREGVVDLLGVFNFRNEMGSCQIASFHTLYKGDLDERLRDKTPIPEKTKMAFARGLFTGLLSLDGAHRDLTPTNILVDGEKLVLTDLQFHWPKGTPPPSARGTTGWIPPEVLDKRELDVDKYDSWGAAQILLLLFTHPKNSGLKWLHEKPFDSFKKQYDQESAFRPQCESGDSDHLAMRIRAYLPIMEPYHLIRRMITQEAIDEILARAELNGPMKTLIENLFVLYLQKRWTIQQAADFLNEHFPNEK